MSTGGSIIAGYVFHKVTGGHNKKTKKKKNKHYLRNAGRKAQQHTTAWRQRRADRGHIGD
jgi:hypothetical protein